MTEIALFTNFYHNQWIRVYHNELIREYSVFGFFHLFNHIFSCWVWVFACFYHLKYVCFFFLKKTIFFSFGFSLFLSFTNTLVTMIIVYGHSILTTLFIPKVNSVSTVPKDHTCNYKSPYKLQEMYLLSHL